MRRSQLCLDLAHAAQDRRRVGRILGERIEFGCIPSKQRRKSVGRDSLRSKVLNFVASVLVVAPRNNLRVGGGIGFADSSNI